MSWVRGKALGKGSFGSVFLGIPIDSISPIVAIKSAPFAKSSTLQKELRILQDLVGFPNEIVQCCGATLSCEFDTLLYNLLLEYAPCGDLLHLIRNYGGGQGRIPESDVKQYAKMLLRGLHCTHMKGYVHCDLKPENILVFPSSAQEAGVPYQLKIADFGVAKMPGEGFKGFGFRGTPYYMSPESVYGMIRPALDIWSLGCVVLQMLTGKKPWGTCDKKELMVQMVYGVKAPEIPEFLPEKGKDFLKRCFETNFARRWTAYMLLNHPFIVNEGLGLPRKMEDDLPPMGDLDEDFIDSVMKLALRSHS